MEDDYEKLVEKSRYFLKDSIRKTINFAYTDQNKGIAPPPLEKPYSTDAEKIKLPVFDWEDRFNIKIDPRHGKQRKQKKILKRTNNS